MLTNNTAQEIVSHSCYRLAASLTLIPPPIQYRRSSVPRPLGIVTTTVQHGHANIVGLDDPRRDFRAVVFNRWGLLPHVRSAWGPPT